MTTNEQMARRRTRIKTQVLGLKSGACMDCGGSFPPVCMDFDHRDPDSKKFAISDAANNGTSLRKIVEEIGKCDLVCANCHRIRTSKRDLTTSGQSRTVGPA